MEWGLSQCGKYKLESLTAATMASALHVIKEGFCKDETVCIGTEVNINPIAAEELLEVCADAALDGVSIVAVDISTGEVVSACFNKLQVATADPTERSFFDEFAEERCTQPSSKALIKFMADVDSRCNMFEKYGVECSLEIMFISTLREHRLKNLGTFLCKTSLDIGRKLKSGPVSHITLQDLGPKYAHMKPRKVTTKIPSICQALATSVATQKIGKTLAFTTHMRISFTEFVYDEKTYVDRVGFDPFCEAIARKLD